MKKVFILRLTGGLGNQLFQYAYARQLQQKYGGTILYDNFLINIQKENYYLDMFNIPSEFKIGTNNFLFFIIRVKCKLFYRAYTSFFHFFVSKEKYQRFQSIFGVYCQLGTTFIKNDYPSITKFNYIIGYFFSEKYFDSVKQNVFSELQCKITPKSTLISSLENIRSNNSVCVHIRRGDYLDQKWESKLFVCDDSFYIKSINYMLNHLESPVFYIFSNSSKDIDWIRDNMKLPGNIVYEDKDNCDYEDFLLMCNCKHFIISNSTYSWWTSYLSKNTDKIVISPKIWNNGIWDVSDIFLNSWVLMDNDK